MPSLSSRSVPVALAVRSRSGASLPDLFVEPAIVWALATGGVVGGPLTAASLVPVFMCALRGDDLVLAVLLNRSASNIRLSASAALLRAERAPYGLVVDAAPSDPRTVPLTAACRLTAVTLRRRTESAWAALDGLDEHGGNAARTASALGRSGQTVRQHRSRGHYHATTDLTALFSSLLRAPAP